MRIAKILEPFNLLWLEIDMYNPEALRQIKESTSTKICTGENQIYMQDYLPYFQARCADVFMVDVAWMGFSPSKKVGDLAQHRKRLAPSTTGQRRGKKEDESLRFHAKLRELFRLAAPADAARRTTAHAAITITLTASPGPSTRAQGSSSGVAAATAEGYAAAMAL